MVGEFINELPDPEYSIAVQDFGRVEQDFPHAFISNASVFFNNMK